MNRFILLVVIFLTLQLQAQIVISPSPADINSGIITITYGSMGDYSLFDPLSDPNLYLYTGLQTDNDPLTWDYHDDITDITTLVPFNFDTAVNAYVAQIDVAGRMYQEEPSLNVVNIPSGTVVQDWYFLIISTDLTRQSADLKGSDYGWQSATLSSASFDKEELKVIAIKNSLYFNKPGEFTVDVYDLSGSVVYTSPLTFISNKYDMPFLKSQNFYIIKVSSKEGSYVFKHYF